MTTTTLRLTSTATNAARGSRTRATLRYLTYPALLIANAAWVGLAIRRGSDLGTAAFLGLQTSLVVLFALERLIPHEQNWQPSKREFVRDFFYFGLNGAVDAGTKVGVALLAGFAAPWANALPFAVAVPVAILLVDFVGYWLHRWGHHGWLWKVHGVHHTPDKVNTWNNNTIHFVNSFYSSAGKLLPLVLLGFDPNVIVVTAYASTLQSFAVHANIDVNLGWLGQLLMGPQHHRLHHSTVVAEAGNFASVTTLWDKVFGTFVLGRAPHAVGVESPRTFPAPNDVWSNQVHPFVSTQAYPTE